jgi:RNA polymerase sigma factor (sigma-70 family)
MMPLFQSVNGSDGKKTRCKRTCFLKHKMKHKRPVIGNYSRQHTYEDVGQRLRPLIYNHLVSRFRSSSSDVLRSNAESEADNVTQQVIIELWKKHPDDSIPDDDDEFDEFVERLKKVAYKLADYRVIDAINQSNRCQESSLEDNVDEASRCVSPLQNLIDQETIKEILQCVEQRFSNKERSVWALKKEGLSIKQTATVLNMTEAAVKMTRGRAIRKLRRGLAVTVSILS